MADDRVVSKEYYPEVMRRLHEPCMKKTAGIVELMNHSCILHHENAPAHASMLVRNLFGRKGNRIYASSYLPDFDL